MPERNRVVPTPQLIVRAILAVVAMLVLVDCEAHMVPRRDFEVSFRNGDVTLAGTLSVPPGSGRPVAVFVSGDGPQDRGDDPSGGDLFRVLADSLVAHGIAEPRHDDRKSVV